MCLIKLTAVKDTWLFVPLKILILTSNTLFSLFLILSQAALEVFSGIFRKYDKKKIGECCCRVPCNSKAATSKSSRMCPHLTCSHNLTPCNPSSSLKLKGSRKIKFGLIQDIDVVRTVVQLKTVTEEDC